MKAITLDRYGPAEALRFEEVDEPQVGDGEVRLRVCAAAVNPGDAHLMRGDPYLVRLGFGLFKPKRRIPGVDVAGRVEAVGGQGTRLQPGDEVFGWCTGAFAERACAKASQLARKPARLTWEQAAAVPASALTALQAVRDAGKVRPGQRVLVVGASGGVGTFAVQIAKAFGATVTGVCSRRNVELVRSLGADDVVDYTVQDFARSGQRHDVVIDLVGDRSLRDCRRVLEPRGTLVLVGGKGGRWLGGTGRWIRALLLSPFVGPTLRPLISMPRAADLAQVTELLEAGKLTPVIDRRYPLAEVPDAIRYVEAGHARGKVVITI